VEFTEERLRYQGSHRRLEREGSLIKKVTPATRGAMGSYKCHRCNGRTWLLYDDEHQETDIGFRSFYMCESGHQQTFRRPWDEMLEGWPPEVIAMAVDDGWVDRHGNMKATPEE